MMRDTSKAPPSDGSFKITVIGAGALGTFHAALLSASGRDVTLVCRERDVAALNRGIRVTGLLEVTAHPRIAAVSPVSDLVFVMVKTYDIASAVRDIPIGPETIVVVVHNGLGGDETAAALLGPGHVAAGVCYSGVTFLAPGMVRLAGFNEIVLGSTEPEVRARLPVAVDALEKTGLKARLTDDIRGNQWEKLYANVGINAITAVTGLDNGKLVEVPDLKLLVAETVREAVRVSEAMGIHPCTDPVENTFRVIQETMGNRSSMLQDVLKGKRTEIDAINGMIGDLGKRRGIPTPYNDILTALVNGIEARG